MAAQFDTNRVVVQPTQQEQPIPTDVFGTGASVFGQQASTLGQEAEAQTRRGEGYFAKANAAFDRSVDQYNKIAVMNATDEAPGLIQKDGNGQIIPPKSFWPSGIHSMAYAQAYSEAARATYRSMASSEFSNFVSETQAKYPTDPGAFKKAVDEKQAAMMQNLDTREAPFISLRLQQIAAQGGTQVAVNLQAANNATLKAQSDVSYAAVVDTASRLAGITAPSAAFGGKDNPAVPGAISTITGSLDPEIQKRVTSADRTPQRNKEVGGAEDSAHLKPGTAVDIGTVGMTDEQKKALVSQVLANPNLRGIGFYDDHIHIDTGHDKHTVWGAVPGSVQNDVRNWQGAPTAMTAIPTSSDIEKIKTQVASSALVTGMLADWQKQVSTIMTPGEIARKKEELAYTVVAKSYAETFKSGRYDDGKGNIDQGKVALAEQQIEKIAAAFPGREDAVRKTLQEGLQFSITQSSRFAAQQQLDDKRKIEPAQRRAMDLALQADALKNTDIAGAQRITDQLRQEARAALNNPSINDAAALQLAQTYYANGSLAKSSFQEGINNKVQGLNAVLGDPTASPNQKASATASLQAIKNTPELWGEMNSGQRAYVQSGLDLVATRRLAADTAGIRMSAPAGDIAPAAFDGMLAKRVASGIDGNLPGQQLTLPEQAQLSAINRDAWNKKQAVHDLTNDAMARAAAGQTPTTDQIAAAKTAAPFRLPGEVADPTDPAHGYALGTPNTPAPQTFDPAKPGHTAALVEHLRRYNYMPDRVKDAIDTMPITPNQQAAQPWIDMYTAVYNVAAEKVVQRTGQRPSDADLKAQVAATIGPTQANYLAIAVRNGELGAETAYKATRDPKASVTGNTGQPTAGAVSAIDIASATYLKTIADDGAKSSVLNKLLSVRLPGTEGWQPTPSELAASKAFQSGPQVAPGLTERLTGRPLFGTGMPSTVTMTGEADDLIKQGAGDLVARDGQMIRMGITSGTVEDHAYRTVANQKLDAGQLEMRRDPNDPNKGIIGLKSANKDWAEKMGLERLDDSTTRAVATQIYRAENRISGGATPDFDPKSVTVTPYVNDAGKTFYYIGATEKRTGMLLKLMDLPANDPRFDAATMAMDRSAMLTLQKNLVGEDGKPVDAGTAANLGIAFSRMVQAPFAGILKEHYVAGAVMNPEQHKAFVDEMNRRMVEIRNTEGLPVKIDWQKSLENIANDPTPDTGRNGMLRDIARQESAKKETERTTQPAPGPVSGVPTPPALSSPVAKPPKPAYP